MVMNVQPMARTVARKKGLLLVMLIMAIVAIGFFMHAHAQTGVVWQKLCNDPEKAETCRITQQLYLSQEGEDGKQQTAGRILGLTVLHVTHSKTNKRQPYMSVQMPMGVDLRPGAVLKVDQGKDIPVRYLRCTQAGCDASIHLDPGLLAALKAGNDLFVGFRPWGSDQTTVLKASLKGFSKAYASLTQ